MLYTQTLIEDDNYVRVGLLLKRIVNKHSDRIKKAMDTDQYEASRVMANIFHYQDTKKVIPLLKVYYGWLLGIGVRVSTLHEMGK